MTEGPTSSAAADEAGAARRPWWLGAALILFGLVWLHGALSLPQAATYAVVGPGLFPAVIGGGLVLLGGLILVAVARGERFEPQDAEEADDEAENKPDLTRGIIKAPESPLSGASFFSGRTCACLRSTGRSHRQRTIRNAFIK